ncbi:MAG: glycosyltransferase family 39 protein, partial [Chloroflexota bacterium]
MHQNTNPNTSQQLPWAALIVLFAGLVLRMTLHDWHGLEGDDAFSLALSRYPISELVPGLFALQLDVHPPLHFLLLKYWVGLAGESLLSLRYLNILMDLLTGALMVGVIRLLKGRHIWIVALLWAASPLLIFGGWLARMYTLLGLWSVAALASVVWAGRGRWWLGVIAAAVCSLLAMYTHITGVLVGAAALCALVTLSLRALPRPASPAARLAGLAAIFASAAAIFAPFAVNVAGLYFSGASLGVSVNPANAVPPSAIPGAVLA